jgi:hypothetical protein
MLESPRLDFNGSRKSSIVLAAVILIVLFPTTSTLMNVDFCHFSTINSELLET